MSGNDGPRDRLLQGVGTRVEASGTFVSDISSSMGQVGPGKGSPARNEASFIERLAECIASVALGVLESHPEVDRSSIDALGLAAVHPGTPASEVLRLCNRGIQAAGRILLQGLGASRADPAVRTAAALELSDRLLALSGLVTGAVSAASVDLEREFARSEEGARRDVVNALLVGASRSDGIAARVEAFGLTLGERHAVVVIAPRSAGDLPAPDQISRRRLETALRGSTRAFVEVRGDLVIVIFVYEGASPGSDPVLTMGRVAKSLGWPMEQLIAGVGPVVAGVPGIGESYRRALRAVESGRALAVSDGVVAYEDIIPAQMVLADPVLAEDLRRVVLGPFDPLTVREREELLRSLAAFIEHRGSLQGASRALFVHRHTLAARLEKVETLTRRSTKSASDLLLFQLALLSSVSDDPSGVAAFRQEDPIPPGFDQSGDC